MRRIMERASSEEFLNSLPDYNNYWPRPRTALFESVLDELQHSKTPLLMVIEDAHWADDATLDLLKFIGRRIARTRALLAITFRDDEVSSSHPLRMLIA